MDVTWVGGGGPKDDEGCQEFGKGTQTVYATLRPVEIAAHTFDSVTLERGSESMRRSTRSDIRPPNRGCRAISGSGPATRRGGLIGPNDERARNVLIAPPSSQFLSYRTIRCRIKSLLIPARRCLVLRLFLNRAYRSLRIHSRDGRQHRAHHERKGRFPPKLPRSSRHWQCRPRARCGETRRPRSGR
jgi:hypothetical protein